jgi:hypothetical protein
MSTEIVTIRNSGSRSVDLDVSHYYGGSKHGPCLQLTAKMEDGTSGYVQISFKDWIILQSAIPTRWKF